MARIINPELCRKTCHKVGRGKKAFACEGALGRLTWPDQVMQFCGHLPEVATLKGY